LDPDRANELLEVAERLAADAAALRAELDLEFKAGQLAAVVADDYDLGEVVGVDQIFGGYCNLSFAVRTRSGAGEQRYFVRKYGRSITEREIRFEHALVAHINGQGLHLAARVYPNKAGGTYVTRDEVHGGERETRFFAVYEMLGGLDKYTWVKNRLTDAEYDTAGRVLAQFHYAAHDFDPGDLGRNQPPIMRMLSELRPAFARYAEQARAGGTIVDAYYLEHLPAIDALLREGTEQEPELQGMPYIPVHCDYHPGNLKWVDGDLPAGALRCCGLFDFDWSKLDYRLFDVAEGIVYFCSSWEGRDDGEVRLDKAAIFLRAYQDEAARFDTPGPLSAAELGALPRMVANANLYVLNWDVSAWYEAGDTLDPDEYLMYLEHQVKFMEFIEAHLGELSSLAEPQATAGASSRDHEKERG
jgi:homoserine kinase type II